MSYAPTDAAEDYVGDALATHAHGAYLLAVSKAQVAPGCLQMLERDTHAVRLLIVSLQSMIDVTRNRAAGRELERNGSGRCATQRR